MNTTRTELGQHFRIHREWKKLTQDELVEKCNIGIGRPAISHLESGSRIPKPKILEALCKSIDLPDAYWRPFADGKSSQRHDFEIALSELVGEPTLSLKLSDNESVLAAEEAIERLFKDPLPDSQLFDLFNKTLVFYGILHCSREFFDHYLKPAAFVSISDFATAVSGYQKDAIRLFSSFSEAYRAFNRANSLEDILRPLIERTDLAHYTERHGWSGTIEEIPDDRLADLGYISAALVKQEAKERKVLKGFLEQLADRLKDAPPVDVLQKYSERKKRKIDSLLRKFDSSLEHGVFSPLFAPDPDALLREAERLAPKTAEELKVMGQTQSKALKNLSHYLTSDFIDVYVATSMRVQADFVSVNDFVRELFDDRAVRHLKLRYFNPTQSWIDDRIAKGLVEALMLKRCSVAIYMAQESDTFGKDSEASVALGQGKPVIVYVPKLSIDEMGIDTEELGKKNSSELLTLARETVEGDELDESLDDESLMGVVLTDRLARVADSSLAKAARTHWADFDLYSGAERIPGENGRATYRKWLDEIRLDSGDGTPIPEEIRTSVVSLLISKGIRFERRARVFRQIHPLALQIILSSGVLNGILVVRSVDQCARVLSSLIANKLDLTLRKEADNYRLIETITGSTIRVISRNELLRNAFEKQEELEAGNINAPASHG